MDVYAERYYQNISSKLSFLLTRIKQDNSQNIQSLNTISEGIFAQFLNALYGWNLVNDNTNTQNVPGYDLRDDDTKIIVQVSSTYDHWKIQDSLTKSDTAHNAGYHFYFLAITEKTQKYTDFKIPENLVFSKDTDILDMDKLLRKVLNEPIDRQKALSELMDAHFGNALQPPKELTKMPGYVDETIIIHREDDLARLHDILQNSKNILLCGFGGIGKTALAKLLLFKIRDSYDDVAWIPYNISLRQSALGSIRDLDRFKTEDEKWNAILSLQNNGRKKLIVIDNADHDEKTAQNPAKDTNLSAITGWNNTTVIVASRLNRLCGYQSYTVGFLAPDDCLELFFRHSDHCRTLENEAAAKKLIELAKYHTFTVELLAKGSSSESNLESYYNDLFGKGFAFPEIEVEADKDEATATIAEHLKKLFDLHTRTPEQTKLLQCFATLPAGEALNKDEIKLWFDFNINTVEPLVKIGWLSRSEGMYSMHPLVKEIILLYQLPENTCEHFLSFIEDDRNGYYSRSEDYIQTTRKIAITEAVLNSIHTGKDTIQFGNIYHNLASAYNNMGIFDKALEFYQKALKIYKAKLGTDHPSTATTYNNIASVYQDKGDLDKALEFLQKALKIREAKLGTDHPSTATTYNNIALVYQDKGDLDKALEFLQKALKIKEAKLGPDHPSTATTYNNIALVYQDKGDLDKALEFLQKALKISEAKLGTDHPDTATTYNNIGALQYEAGNYQDGVDYLLRAFKIRIKKLGVEHPSTENTLSWLEDCYIAAYPNGEPFEDWLSKQLAASTDE